MPIGELGSGFVIGVFATASPCLLPLYPGFLAYLAARSDARVRSGPLLGLVVLAGVMTAMLALGAVIALLAVSTASVLRFVTPIADLVVIGLGIALLLGRAPFAALPGFGSRSLDGGGLRSAYLYGLLYGPIALPCSAPLLVALFGLSLSVESYLEVLAFFVAFGLGLGLPLLALSLLAYSFQLSFVRFVTRHHLTLSRVSGAVLVAVGAADLANNLPFLLLSL